MTTHTTTSWIKHPTAGFHYRKGNPHNGWAMYEIVIDEGDAWADWIANHPATRYTMYVHPSWATPTDADIVARAMRDMADCDHVDIEADGHYRTIHDALNDPTTNLTHS